MPRQGRLDASGLLHHVLARGVAGGRIFRDDPDRAHFLRNFAALIREADARCLAWALMPTHLHLLIRTGRRPLTWLMHRLLLRHAQWVNHRWRRPGHLFQNRYKAILVDEEPYLLRLVRYIHRNPLDARLVPSLAALSRYQWCGHRSLLGIRPVAWQAVDEVLERFSRHRPAARRAYLAWMAEGNPEGEEPILEGGGLVRNAGGWEAMAAGGRDRQPRAGDQRILGDGEFVGRVLREVEHQDRRREGLRRRLAPRDVVRRAAEAMEVPEEAVYGRMRHRATSEARALASYWLRDELGMRSADVARLLNVTSPAVSVAVPRGRKLAEARKLSLDKG